MPLCRYLPRTHQTVYLKLYVNTTHGNKTTKWYNHRTRTRLFVQPLSKGAIPTWQATLHHLCALYGSGIWLWRAWNITQDTRKYCRVKMPVQQAELPLVKQAPDLIFTTISSLHELIPEYFMLHWNSFQNLAIHKAAKGSVCSVFLPKAKCISAHVL